MQNIDGTHPLKLHVIGNSEIALVRDIAFPLACWDGLIRESARVDPNATVRDDRFTFGHQTRPRTGLLDGE